MKAITTRPLVHNGQRYGTGDPILLGREDAIKYGALGLIEPMSAMTQLPDIAKLKISIITLLYHTTREEFDRWAYTFEATTRLDEFNYEVIMLDNTPSAEEYPDREYIRRAVKKRGWRHLKACYNLGFAKGINRASKFATGDVLIFINDDIAFPAPWAEALVLPLYEAENAVVGPKLIRPDFGDYAKYERSDWVCGAVFAVRKADFEKNGGFDERFFFMGEETDYCRFVTKLGQKVVQIDSPVIHYGGETVTAESTFFKENMQRAVEVLDWKWNAEERITASMIVGNEHGRYLEETLDWLLPRVETIVVTDDASTDGTNAILRGYKKKYPDRITIYRNQTNQFHVDEHVLREAAHMRAMRDNPAFIMPMDADEELSLKFDEALTELKKHKAAYNFPIVHLWQDREHRRIDGLWGGQANIRFYDVRWNEPQGFYMSTIHCGSAPVYSYQDKIQRSDIALVHKGWIRHEDFKAKTARNKELDPGGIFEPQDHLNKENPVLVSFKDENVVNWEI